MSSEKILQKILVWLKDNTLLTIIGVILSLIPVIWMAIDRYKKPKIDISICNYSLNHETKCDVFYLISKEYFESDMKGSVVFQIANNGKVDLENVYAMFDAQSVYETKQSVSLSNGKTKTVENHVLRFRRFDNHELMDDIAGDRISVNYSSDEETITGVFRTIQRGMVKLVQPFFTIDREIAKNNMEMLNEALKGKDTGDMVGAKVYDYFSIDISYAASGMTAKHTDEVNIFVAEDYEIEDFLSEYENYGSLFNMTISDWNDIKRRSRDCILLYPKYTVEDGIVNVDVLNGQYYYVKYDYGKRSRRRTIRIKNMKNGVVNTYHYMDSPERSKRIRREYSTLRTEMEKRRTGVSR